MVGFEPTEAEAHGVTAHCNPPTLPHTQRKLVAGPGIGPGVLAYETNVLPLHYPAIYKCTLLHISVAVYGNM